MRYTYVYKTSDGVRHEARIAAPSREAAFSVLRRQGIRPVKVVADDGSRENGARHGVRRRVVVAIALACVATASWTTFVFLRPARVPFYRADGTLGVLSSGSTVRAITRRQIRGDEAKIRELAASTGERIFRHASERLLARYAQPGRVVAPRETTACDAALRKDFEQALESPIETSPDETPECVELKEIVAGMKEELRMFLASGGTLDEYLVRLEERQKMEVSFREQAALKVEEAVRTGDGDSIMKTWKTQNAWLQMMGIARLPLPEALAVRAE